MGCSRLARLDVLSGVAYFGCPGPMADLFRTSVIDRGSPYTSRRAYILWYLMQLKYYGYIIPVIVMQPVWRCTRCCRQPRRNAAEQNTMVRVRAIAYRVKRLDLQGGLCLLA